MASPTDKADRSQAWAAMERYLRERTDKSPVVEITHTLPLVHPDDRVFIVSWDLAASDAPAKDIRGELGAITGITITETKKR